MKSNKIQEVAHAAAVNVRQEVAFLTHRITDLSAAPPWMSKDPLIIRAYRREQKSIQGCLNSLWYLHNETVNIWSHLSVGTCFLLFSTWMMATQGTGGFNLTRGDLWALQVYLVGATLCCMFSAFYHCMSCHSEHVASRCLKLDYLGIMFNITSTCISTAYFGLRAQDSTLANRYIAVIGACGLAAFWAALDPSADGPHAAKFQAVVFIALGASGFAPTVHAVLAPALTVDTFALEYIIAESCFYLAATAFYVNRFPEKHWPGVFDVWGASHQLFHLLVNVAQILHLWGLKRTLEQGAASLET